LTKPFQLKAHTIVPANTAAFISINFENFNEFYNNLINEYHTQNPGDLESYQKQLKKIENLLGINLNEDLFSWFGNEIMLLKIRPFPGYNKDEWMMTIHSNNIKYAAEKLKFITDKIDQNSPFRFKSEGYRGYLVGYLNVGTLFRLLFGKLFVSFEKPYFVIIENFVLFANSKELLYRFIDDYLKGNSLYQTDYYQQIYNELNYKGNITAYLNLPNFYQYLYSDLNPEQRKQLKEKKDLILGFSDFVCQLTSEKGLLKTSIICNYNENATFEAEVTQLEEAAEMEINHTYYENLKFVPEVPVAQNPGNGKYIDYFENNSVRTEGLYEDSLKTNLWRAYYENGNLENAVNYKKGTVDGQAYFYYNESNQALKAEMIFKENKINGLYQEYYSIGTRKVSINYNNGLPEGDVFYYYPDGSIKIEGKYKNGKKRGNWKVYSPKGELLNKE